MERALPHVARHFIHASPGLLQAVLVGQQEVRRRQSVGFYLYDGADRIVVVSCRLEGEVRRIAVAEIHAVRVRGDCLRPVAAADLAASWLQPDAQELSLCFDPESDLIGEFDEGLPLFDGDKPSENLNGILKFCEDFEVAGQRTSAFVKELQDLDLLIDGEVSIQPNDASQPFIYRGFRMVDEQKFRDLNGDQLRKINQNGILPLIVAHLFSLSLVRDIFARQMAMGKVPPQNAEPLTADA